MDYLNSGLMSSAIQLRLVQYGKSSALLQKYCLLFSVSFDWLFLKSISSSMYLCIS